MILFRKTQLWDAVIGSLILLEIAFMLFFRTREYSRAINEIAVFFLSLSIGLAILVKYYGRQVVYVSKSSVTGDKKWRNISFALLLSGIVVFLWISGKAFLTIPIDATTSDIIPTIQVAVQRFLKGQHVYSTITNWGNQPLTYLPLQWLPFSIAELLHFDYRWIAVAIFCIATTGTVLRVGKASGERAIMVVVLLLFNGWMILQHEQGIVTTTVELMIAGYYILFIMGLSGNNPWLRGFAIGLCLLSRYSLILWLPLWFLMEMQRPYRRDLFRSLIVICGMLLVIYVIPFLLFDPGAFMRGYNYYTSAALGEWHHLNNEGHPAHLYLGLGFARWFYEYLPGKTIAERIDLLRLVHLILSLGVVLVMGIWYWYKRQKIDHRIFAMASFKIYLVFFLNFIQVPYAYLMITATFVSIAIFAELPRYRIMSHSGETSE